MASATQHIRVDERQETQWPTPPLRLNRFQEMMLAWDEIHPYNAVHAVELGGRADVFALRHAVHNACVAAGVGELAVERKRRTYRYHSVEDITIRQLPAELDTERTLRTAISEEMNKPFPAGPHFPLRWIVFDTAAGDAHSVVLAYHHVAADAYSIQALLARVLHRYLDLPPRSDDSGVYPSTSNYGNPLSQRSQRSVNVRSLGRTIHQYFKLRYAHRMHEDRSGHSETGFLLRFVPDGMLDRLRDVCKAQGAGLNDAFLAALTVALAQRTPARRTHRRRRKIAVATVLSRRKRAHDSLSNGFGVCLSDAALLIDRPDAGMREVLAQIVPQTRRLKAARGAMEHSWRFLAVKYLWPALRIPHSEASYGKVFPLCAGVSTVSTDEVRFGEAMQLIRRYVRACPPGPAMPMLLSPTAHADRLELGLVFRPSCLTEARARDLLNSVVDVLQGFVV